MKIPTRITDWLWERLVPRALNPSAIRTREELEQNVAAMEANINRSFNEWVRARNNEVAQRHSAELNRELDALVRLAYFGPEVIECIRSPKIRGYVEHELQTNPRRYARER